MQYIFLLLTHESEVWMDEPRLEEKQMSSSKGQFTFVLHSHRPIHNSQIRVYLAVMTALPVIVQLEHPLLKLI